MTETLKVHFLGAAGTVTGSKYLLETEQRAILVDCGLFQGLKKLRLLNWNYLPVDVGRIDTVLLSHGHLDHCGYLPRLPGMGFKGRILGTAPTLDVAEVILRDCAEIMEEDAKRANSEGYSRHTPAKALYTLKDVERTLGHFRPVTAAGWHDLGDGIRARFRYNGHIIGAAFIELDIAGRRVVFSGDIGRESDVLMRRPERPEAADYLFIESTYGDRLHSAEPIEAQLQHAIGATLERGGTLIIPSFAVERAQTLMLLLWRMQERGSIPNVPVYMDSPMGAGVLDIFERHHDWHTLSTEECRAMCKHVHVVESYRRSLEIIADTRPKIVIAGSGMLTGGRVLGYLQRYLGDSKSTVLLAGYQAEGTRGRQLQAGAPELKLYGGYYPVRAQIATLQGLSAHADQRELLAWLGDMRQAPRRIFVVHGEGQAADCLRVKIQDAYGWDCHVPELYEIQEL